MDTKTRLLAKSLTWQASGFVSMMGISYLFSGSFSASMGIALTGMVSGFTCYFLHELAWTKVRWGRRF